MYIEKDEVIKIIWPLKDNKNIYRHGICKYVDDFGTHFEIIFKYKRKPYRIIYTLELSPSELTEIKFSIYEISKKELIKYLDNGIYPSDPKNKYSIEPVILRRIVQYRWEDLSKYEVDKKHREFIRSEEHKRYEQFRIDNNILLEKETILIPKSFRK